MVGDEICDSEIRLVANCRDERNLRTANCPRNLFLVESPKLFSRTATTSDDKNIDQIRVTTLAQRALLMLIDEPNGACDVRACMITLHTSWLACATIVA